MVDYHWVLVNYSCSITMVDVDSSSIVILFGAPIATSTAQKTNTEVNKKDGNKGERQNKSGYTLYIIIFTTTFFVIWDKFEGF